MTPLKNFIINLYKNPLYKNSFWLMAGSFVMAAVGFLYWLVAARLYTPTQIGLSATFLSVAAVINLIAMMGFNITLIRYLPTSKHKDKEINTSFTIISVLSLIAGIIYVTGISFWTHQLIFLTQSFPIIILILIFFPLNILNTITDSVFTAYREAEWVFVSNAVQSFLKLLLLILLPVLGVWGIIGSNFIGVSAAVVVCFVIIIYRYRLRLKPEIDNEILHKVKKYTFGNYISGLIGGLPTLLMPIIITNRISPEQTAFFYVPNMIGQLLLIIPTMISRSYLTEGSHINEAPSIKKPLLFSYTILIPLVAFVVIFGQNVLDLFGHNYASNGYSYLVLISVSILFSVINYFLATKLLIMHKMKMIIVINSIGSVSYLGLAWILTAQGINGIGYAAIASQLISILFLLFL